MQRAYSSEAASASCSSWGYPGILVRSTGAQEAEFGPLSGGRGKRLAEAVQGSAEVYLVHFVRGVGGVALVEVHGDQVFE